MNEIDQVSMSTSIRRQIDNPFLTGETLYPTFPSEFPSTSSCKLSLMCYLRTHRPEALHRSKQLALHVPVGVARAVHEHGHVVDAQGVLLVLAVLDIVELEAESRPTVAAAALSTSVAGHYVIMCLGIRRTSRCQVRDWSANTVRKMSLL